MLSCNIDWCRSLLFAVCCLLFVLFVVVWFAVCWFCCVLNRVAVRCCRAVVAVAVVGGSAC